METHVTFVLDSSGSMAKIEEDTRGGFNTFLQDQQDAEGTATVSLFQFATTVDQVYHARPIDEAPELDGDNYTPGGSTALYDALTTAVDETRSYVDGKDGAERPENVVVVVLTDGKENASETPRKTVRERVEVCQTERDWEFLFIGANQDAALAAESVGIDEDRSLDMAHSGEGARAAYESTSERVRETRREGRSEGFTEEDRRRQEESD
ncbi:vWA domain-containing protein [Haloarchaeobius amylolyticus]|uniref:vWA domain-containing protein n=1 Tax=Haloarchaeobius amylolyticus TaxID=1198296 RepID=UPI0022720679|nr:vWA domain-containing protein [Haloarchaeobius amylolyticus]